MVFSSLSSTLRQEILKVISGRDAPYVNVLIMNGREQTVTVANICSGASRAAKTAIVSSSVPSSVAISCDADPEPAAKKAKTTQEAAPIDDDDIEIL